MASRIVVPLDGSDFGKRALPLALALASRNGAEVELVHVHERPLRAVGAPAFDTRLDAEERDRMHRELTALASELAGASNLSVIPRFLDGEVAPSLSDYIAKGEPRLVVMTTHGRGGLSRFWLGSVAEQLIREAPVPVLLLRSSAGQPAVPSEPLFGRVLMPVDDLEMAAEMVPHVLSVATPGRTTVALVSVVDPRLALRATAIDVRPITEGREPLFESICRVTALQLEHFAAKLRDHDVAVTSDVLVDQSVAQSILSFAEAREVELIALSTHARSPLGRLALGGTADKVVRGATCPVLIRRAAGRRSGAHFP